MQCKISQLRTQSTAGSNCFIGLRSPQRSSSHGIWNVFLSCLGGSEILSVVTSRWDRFPRVGSEDPQLASPITMCEETETEGEKQTETETQREEWLGEPDGCPLISSLLTRPESQNTAWDRERVRARRSTSLWFGLLQIFKSTAGSECSNKQTHAHKQPGPSIDTWMHPQELQYPHAHTKRLIQTLNHMQLKKCFSSEDELVKS